MRQKFFKKFHRKYKISSSAQKIKKNLNSAKTKTCHPTQNPSNRRRLPVNPLPRFCSQHEFLKLSKNAKRTERKEREKR
jgi:hypothetical protein